MEIKEVVYNLNALTKPSQVLRKAVEHLEYDMASNIGGNAFMRDGCCAAIDAVRWAASDRKRNTSEMKPQSAARLQRKVRQTLDAVAEAKCTFDSLFKPKRAESYGYWFGEKMTDKQQTHRITALLTAAAILEAEGK